MTPLPLTVQAALAAVVLIAAFTDIRSRNIANWLTVGGILAGFVLHPLATGWPGLWLSLKGFGLAALIFLPIFYFRWLGGGDVKLMGAVGALAGPTNLITIFILDSILAGIAALILMLMKGRARRTIANIGRAIRSMLHGRAPYRDSAELEAGSDESLGMPRGVTIAIATLLVLWATPR
jgi:prepilin peptidase CpaA